MLRLLTEIISRRIKKETGKIKGFEYETLSLKVKIKGPARKSYILPAGIRGKTFTIERIVFKDWTIKKGDLIILNQDETRKCISTLKKGTLVKRWRNFTKKDIDGDGNHEIVFDNPFLTAVVAPQYGARLWQLRNNGTMNNELFGGNFIRDKGYIELGGIEETLSKQGKPDELWNGKFKSEKSNDNNSICFSYKMKKEKGISVRKQFTFYNEFPGLLKTFNIIFKPEKTKKKDKKKKKQKKSIRLTQRVFFAMGGIPDYHNLFHIPTKSGINTIRFNKPLFKRGWEDEAWWEWQHLYFSPDPGTVVLERENSNDILLFFFNKEELDFIWTGDKKRTPRLHITYKEKKIEPKKKKKYGTLIAIANDFSFQKQEVLFASRGKATGDFVPLCFVYYSKRNKSKQSISLQRKNINKTNEMLNLKVPGIPGTFFYYTTIENKETMEVTASIKDKNLKVKVELEQ